MAAIVLLCQAVLAATFALSTVAKVRDREGYKAFRKSLPATLGIAARFSAPMAAGVVAAEVVAAVLLVLGVAQPGLVVAGFLVAAALMAVFTAAIGLMLARGVTEPCHCFGASARPPGGLDLIRNAVLLAIAVAGLVLAPESGGDPAGSPATALAIGFGVLNAAILVMLLRQIQDQNRMLRISLGEAADQGPIIMEADGTVGRFEAETLDGERITQDSLQGITLVGFFSPTCPACAEAVPGFVLRARERGRDSALAVLVGDPQETWELREKLQDSARIVTEPAMGAVARAFRLDGFPGFALLDGRTVLGSSFLLNRLPEPV